MVARHATAIVVVSFLIIAVVGTIVMRTFDQFRTNYVRPPAQFTLMLKTLATIESFARSLDPDFNIMEAMKPYARRANLRDLEPKRLLRHMRRAMADAGDDQ